jgi:hypothetical protein
MQRMSGCAWRRWAQQAHGVTHHTRRSRSVCGAETAAAESWGTQKLCYTKSVIIFAPLFWVVLNIETEMWFKETIEERDTLENSNPLHRPAPAPSLLRA